jgi:hypothetical protein
MKAVENEMSAWRDKKVMQKHIEGGDLVLLRSPRMEASGKVELKWIGPFLVTEITRLGSFHLADTKGRMLELSWNADSLHRFYI